jgi:hypothetical protein
LPRACWRGRSATLVGRPTDGGTSPLHFDRYRLTAESILSTSSGRFFDLGAKRAEVDMFGVEPDIVVELVLDDLIHGRAFGYGADDDPILAVALRVLSP